MNVVFPFGLETATLFYLSLYMLTLVVHVIFMSYVLAGSLYLAWANLFPGTGSVPRLQQPLACLLRDWMPFVLSAAITAGVAPLLFVQIAYPVHFYTANLLLGWRWMVVVPVLTFAFYLLYVLKSTWITKLTFAWRTAVGMAAAGCFLFIAFCWSANHLLGIDSTQWPTAYASSQYITSHITLAMRLLMWIAGTFPVMCIFAGWQLTFHRPAATLERTAGFRQLAFTAMTGLVISCITAVAYISQMSEEVTAHLMGTAGMLWMATALVGITLQIAGWLWRYFKSSMNIQLLLLLTLGGILMLIGTVVLREIIRVTIVGSETLSSRTTVAFEVGGFWVFLFFATLNTGLICLCIRLIWRSEITAEKQ